MITSEDGDAVDPEVPVHAERVPRVLVVRDQLEAAVGHLHRHRGRNGEAQRHERDDQREGVGQLLLQAAVEAQQPEHGRADGGQEHEQREEREVVVPHHPHQVLLSMKPMMRAIPSAMPSA
jgi:hypothetical protein